MHFLRKCFESVLSEFQLKNLGFSHHAATDFYQSQWQRGSKSLYYLIYRWIWALCFVGVFTVCLVWQFSDGKYFIFLTNWGIISCTLTQVIAAVLVTKWHFSDRRSSGGNSLGSMEVIPTSITIYASAPKSGMERRAADKNSQISLPLPLLVKCYWMLHVVALALALVITIIYYSFLYGKMDKPQRFPTISFVTHCLNSVFMLIDFMIVAFPVRLLQVIYPMICTIMYCIFTVIYYFCGGTDEYDHPYVYPILHWVNPGKAMTTFAGVFMLFILISIILYGLYHFKFYLHRVLYNRMVYPVKEVHV